ncbi:Uncharacterized protein BWINRASL_00397 [Bacillus mycoides]|nr:Uncharacterized protein BWINRASL_00397 [Bacillus mycoides]
MGKVNTPYPLQFTPRERALRLSPQNSANAQNLGGRSTARQSPIGEG